MSKTKTKMNPLLEPNQSGEEEEKKPAGIFGRLTQALFETTFILTILIFGTVVGTLMALVLPLGFPFMILWKRYT